MTYEEIIKKLTSLKNQKSIEGMARFGINPKNALGISIYTLRPMSKDIGKDPSFAKSTQGKHDLALKLWNSGIHEARILAAYIDEPKKVTEEQMDKWVADFDSWDVCDQVISNLFDKSPIAYNKAFEWSKRKEEFEKRAGFVMMAALSVHDKKASDEKLMKFFPVIKREAQDERNFVKKAVNWALRQLGKRNPNLRKKSIQLAKEIIKLYPNSKSAQWIAKDALRELSKKNSIRMITIIFESHSTTLDNEAHLSSGHFDIELSKLGIIQSQELGKRYENEKFDAIFCSDLQRSYKTAEIAFGSKYPILKDKRLRECNYGDLTRSPSSIVDSEKLKRINTPFQNGESYKDCIKRMKDFLENLIMHHNGKRVMIIGHRATQYGLESLIKGIPLEEIISTPWKWQPGWIYMFSETRTSRLTGSKPFI